MIHRINELYYDVDASGYEGHTVDEIFGLELERYKRFFAKFASVMFGEGNKTIVDMATGTGFIPTQLQPYVRPNYTLMCVDISDKMLSECKKILETKSLSCAIQYKKTDGTTIPVPDDSVDVLTLNSALHHMPDMQPFFTEVDRVLKRGGIFMIGHELNAAFQDNKVIWTVYRFLYNLYHPASLIAKLQRSEDYWTRVRYPAEPLVRRLTGPALPADPCRQSSRRPLRAAGADRGASSEVWA